MPGLDDDLNGMTPEQLRQEVVRLRTAVRKDRDAVGHELCWYRPELWDLLPEFENHDMKVPPWDEFLKKCVEYRSSLEPSVKADR